jgi:glycosyl transferase family 1
VNRREIEARAQAQALVRDELSRWGALRAKTLELESRAGRLRRAAAVVAGSRLVGLVAGYGSSGRLDAGKSELERRGAKLRRRRFRLERRKRVLAGGVRALPATASSGALRATPLRERGTPGVPSFCIRIAAPDWEAANYGGDAALARSLARALARRGHEAVVQVGREVGDPLGESMDVLLMLRGRMAGEPTAGCLNLLWLISHPEEVEPTELNRYDHIFVASRPYAQRLAPLVRPPVEPLLQFTDLRLFHPDPDARLKHPVAFVGNWRGEFRRIVWDAIQAGYPPALYGRGWDLLVPEYFVAEHIPHRELHRLYSSCEILLCDHWDDMRRHGFVSNRVFDALACETFILADDNEAIAEELPEAVPTYSSQADLREKLDCYLASPDQRRRMARRGRELVLAEHTVERRVERLLEIVAANRPGHDEPASDASAAAGSGTEGGAGSA